MKRGRAKVVSWDAPDYGAYNAARAACGPWMVVDVKIDVWNVGGMFRDRIPGTVR